jgi:hypothetical protein
LEQFSEPGVLERCRSEGKKNGKVREDLPGKGVCETGINAHSEGEENFVGDSEIIALGGASNETKDRPLG